MTVSTYYSIWNPFDMNASVTLSNGNLTASCASGVRMVRSDAWMMTSGQIYWEVHFDSGTTPVIGIANHAAATSTYPGGDANGWGYCSDGKAYNAGSGSAYGATYAIGDYIGIALDIGAGTLTFYKNNASQGVAFSGLSTTAMLYAAFGMQVVGTAAQGTANFGATAQHYTKPGGFNAGLYMTITGNDQIRSIQGMQDARTGAWAAQNLATPGNQLSIMFRNEYGIFPEDANVKLMSPNPYTKTISGTAVTSPPMSRTVRCYRKTDGHYVAVTTSDPSTGAFSFNNLALNIEYFVIVFDDNYQQLSAS